VGDVCAGLKCGPSSISRFSQITREYINIPQCQENSDVNKSEFIIHILLQAPILALDSVCTQPKCGLSYILSFSWITRNCMNTLKCTENQYVNKSEFHNPCNIAVTNSSAGSCLHRTWMSVRNNSWGSNISLMALCVIANIPTIPWAHKIILLALASALSTLQIDPPHKLFYWAIVELHAKQCIYGTHVAVSLPILGQWN